MECGQGKVGRARLALGAGRGLGGRLSTGLPAAVRTVARAAGQREGPRSLWGSRGLAGANPGAFVDVERPVVRLWEQEQLGGADGGDPLSQTHPP